MENTVEIKYDDISIADEHLNGYDYDRCKNALWSIYNFFKKIKSDYISDSGRTDMIINNLYLIGRFASFQDGGLDSLVFAGNEKVNINGRLQKIKFGSPKVFPGELEKNGFLFSDFTYSNGDGQTKKHGTNEIEKFTLSYKGDNFKDVIFGLKLFADICAKFSSGSRAGVFFQNGDISIAFKDTDVEKKEKEHIDNMKSNVKSIKDMLSEERFNIVSDRDKAFMIAFDEAMNGLGYGFGGKTGVASKNEKYVFIYTKAGLKSNASFARFLIREDCIILRIYFNDIDEHRKYIENAPSHIKDAFAFNGGDCINCSSTCMKSRAYVIDGNQYRKCCHSIAHFNAPSVERLPDYMALLTEFYPNKK